MQKELPVELSYAIVPFNEKAPDFKQIDDALEVFFKMMTFGPISGTFRLFSSEICAYLWVNDEFSCYFNRRRKTPFNHLIVEFTENPPLWLGKKGINRLRDKLTQLINREWNEEQYEIY